MTPPAGPAAQSPTSGTAAIPNRPPLLLVHGWGLDPTLWHRMRARLALAADALDLGYGTTPAAVPPGRVIGVGHSFGAMWLLHHLAPRLQALVIVNGFARFTATTDWPYGVAPRFVQRMQTRFPANPQAVLSAFRARIGLPPCAGPLNAARLEADLTHLATWDERQTLAALHIPVLCLAAQDDPLIPPALTTATATLANGTCRFAAGGHLLPLTQPAWCATQMASFIDSL